MKTAKHVMNPDIVVVPEDMGVRELSSLLSDKMITGAPVVNKQGRVVGVVSAMDIVRYFGHEEKNLSSDANHRPEYYVMELDELIDSNELKRFHVEEYDDPTRVSEIMTPIVFEVNEDASIVEIAQMMVRGRIHRVIVTRNGFAVGIVTSLDLLKAVASLLPK